MSYFRIVHQCDGCGKIYRSEYWPTIHNGGIIGAAMVCGKCGSMGKIMEIVAKPRFFGFGGWTIAKGSQRHHEGKSDSKN